jgi:hypothetical protein
LWRADCTRPVTIAAVFDFGGNRISLSSPRSLDRRKFSVSVSSKSANNAGFFGDFPSLKWTAENGLLGIKGVSIPAFLGTPQRQSGFADMLGERNAIKIDHVAKPT